MLAPDPSEVMCPKCPDSQIVSETLEFHSFAIDGLDEDGDYQVAYQMEDRWYVLSDRLVCIECDRTYNPTTGKLQSKFMHKVYLLLLKALARF